MKSTHLLLVSASAIAIVALCSSMVSIYHLKATSSSALSSDRSLPATSVIHSALQDFERGSKKKASTRKAPGTSRSPAKEVTSSIKEPLKTSKTATSMTTQHRTSRSAYASLDCSKYTGGPSTLDETAEMIYWKDRSDASYDPAPPSTYKSGGYLTFEPDGGGWNNIRMAMETIVALAIAMNRTLVLPAEQRMYLLGTDRGKQKTDFSFRDFFPMSNLQELRVITTQEFLEQHAMKGKMEYRQVAGGLKGVAFPPENRTDWNGQDVKLLKEWLRNTTETPRWNPSQCLAVFPIDHTHIPELQAMLQDIIQKDSLTASEIPPPDLSTATTRSRLREHLAKRGELCVYDNAHEPVLHFMCSHKDHVRMLVHFYAFVFFEDMAADLWLKRFVRDHLRYVDEIQCAAARIVASLRRESPEGIFDTMHIRRGDFQYKNTRIEAKEILENIKDVIPPNTTIFIATDERQKTFFNPIKEYYNVKFLDDYKDDLLTDINKNFYGMIDQLIAARGRNFFGCWHSTFTGYIMRMRGYHAAREQSPGHLDGVLPSSYYYVPKSNRNAMHSYAPLHGAFFNREFPTSWRQLDFDLPGEDSVSAY